MRDRLEVLTSKKATIYLLLLVCLLLRVGFAWYKHSTPITGDGAIYCSIARNIANGNGFVWHYDKTQPKLVPTAWGCPIYPTFLALLFLLTSGNSFIVYFAQSIIDTITCFLVFRMTLYCTRRSLASVFAALAYAFYPPFIMMIATGWADTLGYLFSTAALFALIVAFRKSISYTILAGVLLGLAILVKPAMLAFPIFVAVMFLLMRKGVDKWLLKAVAYVLVSFAVVMPWTIRNYMAMHAFVPVASHGGQTLWAGVDPADDYTLLCWNAKVDSDKLHLYNDPKIPVVSHATYLRITAFEKRLEKMDEIKRNNALTKASIDVLKADPKRTLILTVKKFFRLWFHLFWKGPRTKANLIIAPVNFLLILLAVFSYKRAIVDRYLLWTTWGFAIYTSLMSMATFAYIRYSYPVFPFILALAAATITIPASKRCKEATSDSASKHTNNIPV